MITSEPDDFQAGRTAETFYRPLTVPL